MKHRTKRTSTELPRQHEETSSKWNGRGSAHDNYYVDGVQPQSKWANSCPSLSLLDRLGCYCRDGLCQHLRLSDLELIFELLTSLGGCHPQAVQNTVPGFSGTATHIAVIRVVSQSWILHLLITPWWHPLW